jgi:5-formyltetrahydrofolate cyclo-ligase
MTDIVALKTRLRAEALARRDAIEIDDRLDWDRAIAAHVLTLAPFDGPVAGYWPMRSEADPRPIMEAVAEAGIALALPAVVESRLQFRAWRPYEPLVPGGFGTLVPSPDSPVVTPRMLIVPLSAFDARCYRLGYGKGYYDAAIAALPGVRTIGIAYAAQQVAEVPTQAHDQRLDAIVTERGVVLPIGSHGITMN